MFFICWEMQYNENSYSYGQLVTGSFIMTMHLLMHQVSCSFFVKHQITQVTQPLSSPDLAPCDFWLFPKLKSPLKGKRFQNTDETQENMMGQLMAIPTKDFAESFEQWKRHWQNCVRSQGAYFEGDWGVIVLRTMFLVSSSINVSIFHSIWLDTFWTELLYVILKDMELSPRNITFWATKQ